MLSKILIAVGVLAVGAVGLIAMQPEDYKVTRTQTIAASPSAVHGLINDFHKWDAWSPWAKLDPNMKTTFEGPASGPGAMYSWTGDDKVGEGKMTILESDPGKRVKIQLDFLKPIASTSLTEFRVSPAGDGSSVEWQMEGKNNFMSKAFCLVMGGMDKMIGPDFEKGLAQMKSAAEAGTK